MWKKRRGNDSRVFLNSELFAVARSSSFCRCAAHHPKGSGSELWYGPTGDDRQTAGGVCQRWSAGWPRHRVRYVEDCSCKLSMIARFLSSNLEVMLIIKLYHSTERIQIFRTVL